MTANWAGEVPADGFEWIRGIEGQFGKCADDFLVARSGQVRSVPFGNTLYEDFANLEAERTAVLAFANTHGPLLRDAVHFHLENGEPCTGEPWTLWDFQLRRFRKALELWEQAKLRDVRSINRFLEAVRKPGANWLVQPPIFEWPEDPILFARAVVRETVNYELSATAPPASSCAVCALRSTPMLTSFTKAQVRKDFSLAIVSSDLLKTVWLQLAEYIAGQRLLKKCEAQDCPRKYMDVTDSKRPGARRMHDTCEERLRKQNYRINLKRRKQK